MAMAITMVEACKCGCDLAKHYGSGPVMVPVELAGKCKDDACYCLRYEPRTANSVRFTLPSMPVSVNALYNVIFNERRVELKPAARRWKSSAKEHMPPWKHDKALPVRVDVHFEFKRLTKGEKVRTKDPANYIKLILDAVAERYGFNDCLIWSGSWTSANASREQVTVIVTEMEEHKP